MARKIGQIIGRDLRISLVRLYVRPDGVTKKQMCPTGESIGGFATHKHT